MFNWFKKKDAATKPKSRQSAISDDDSQTIVYAFIDIMAAGAPFIGDASTLPYTKNQIRQAFVTHIEHYEAMRRISEATFRSMGYHETVQQLRAMSVRIDDWHDIDPEDRESVARINRIQGPPPEWALPLIGKYFQRAVAR